MKVFSLTLGIDDKMFTSQPLALDLSWIQTCRNYIADNADMTEEVQSLEGGGVSQIV